MLAILRTPTQRLLAGMLLLGGAIPAQADLHLEVFAAASDIANAERVPPHRKAAVTAYAVDGLQQLKAHLSQDLTADPGAAETEALRRIAALGEAHWETVQQAATGLAKAREYGLDRYPAIVINGIAVVYGVTDPNEALQRYDAWREAHFP